MTLSLNKRLKIPETCFDYFEVTPINTIGWPESGLKWKVKPSRAVHEGSWAGRIVTNKSSGRQDWQVKFKGKLYYVSRVIYFLSTGVDPQEYTVDHIDRNSLNNNISNLRLLHMMDQGHNRKVNSNNKSGLKGVFWSSRSKRWKASVVINSERKHIGYFTCKKKACIAYNETVSTLLPNYCDVKCNDLSSVSCNCSFCSES